MVDFVRGIATHRVGKLLGMALKPDFLLRIGVQPLLQYDNGYVWNAEQLNDIRRLIAREMERQIEASKNEVATGDTYAVHKESTRYANPPML